MKLRPTTQNRPTKRESRGLSEPTRAQIQRERVQVWRRVVALPSLRPGLRRLGRDYSRDLRPAKWGPTINLRCKILTRPCAVGMSALCQMRTHALHQIGESSPN